MRVGGVGLVIDHWFNFRTLLTLIINTKTIFIWRLGPLQTTKSRPSPLTLQTKFVNYSMLCLSHTTLPVFVTLLSIIIIPSCKVALRQMMRSLSACALLPSHNTDYNSVCVVVIIWLCIFTHFTSIYFIFFKHLFKKKCCIQLLVHALFTINYLICTQS